MPAMPAGLHSALNLERPLGQMQTTAMPMLGSSHRGVGELRFVEWLLQVACGHPCVQAPLGGLSAHISCLIPSDAGEEREGGFLQAYCGLREASSRGWWNQHPNDNGSKRWISVGV